MTERHPRKCTGTSSRTGKPCERWAMKGQRVCATHGGRAPQSKRKGKERVEREAALRALRSYGHPLDTDPHRALLDELCRTAGHVHWLSLRIAALEERELHGPVGGGPEAYPREEPHVWVRLYQEEREHLRRVAMDCIRAGIEERRVKLAEEQGRLIADFARGLMRELGIDPGSEQARRAMRRQLTLIAGGAA